MHAAQPLLRGMQGQTCMQHAPVYLVGLPLPLRGRPSDIEGLSTLIILVNPESFLSNLNHPSISPFFGLTFAAGPRLAWSGFHLGPSVKRSTRGADIGLVLLLSLPNG
jgi:hypothetical protein